MYLAPHQALDNECFVAAMKASLDQVSVSDSPRMKSDRRDSRSLITNGKAFSTEVLSDKTKQILVLQAIFSFSFSIETFVLLTLSRNDGLDFFS